MENNCHEVHHCKMCKFDSHLVSPSNPCDLYGGSRHVYDHPNLKIEEKVLAMYLKWSKERMYHKFAKS